MSMEFVLLVVGDGGASASAAELGGRTGRLAGWLTELRDRGILREGGHIDGPAVRVRSADGRPAVIDIPADAGGDVRSWLLIEADGIDAAVGLARSCPEAAHGDVRVLAVDPEGALE